MNKQFHLTVRDFCLWMADIVVSGCDYSIRAEEFGITWVCDNGTMCPQGDEDRGVFTWKPEPCPDCTADAQAWRDRAEVFRCWHEWEPYINPNKIRVGSTCSICGIHTIFIPEKPENPDYSDPRTVRAVLEELGEWEGFVMKTALRMLADILTSDKCVKTATGYLKERMG